MLLWRGSLQTPQQVADPPGRAGRCGGLVSRNGETRSPSSQARCVRHCEAGGCASAGRRPADVYLPAWGLHGPAVFDLAVTNGLRGGSTASSATDGSHACAAYEERKRNHLQTAALCRQQGLQLIPLIAEAVSGGWGREAMKAWRQLGASLGQSHRRDRFYLQ